MFGHYKVITLCGSTRFKDEFMEAQKRLPLEGNIVISVGLFGHSGDYEVWENMDAGTLTATKEMFSRVDAGNIFWNLFASYDPVCRCDDATFRDYSDSDGNNLWIDGLSPY